MTFDEVTRVTIVGLDGIEYENYSIYEEGCTILVQDQGKTIKVIPKFK